MPDVTIAITAFVVAYLLIATERIPKTAATLDGAAIMLGLSVVGLRERLRGMEVTQGHQADEVEAGGQTRCQLVRGRQEQFRTTNGLDR